MSRDLEQLLRVGITAARNGNTPAARALFRALTREYPAEPRVWLGLAGCAENRDEQRHALEQVLHLSPEHEQARRALARLGPAPAPRPAAAALNSTGQLPAEAHDAAAPPLPADAPTQPSAANTLPPAPATPPQASLATTADALPPPPPPAADAPPHAVVIAPAHPEAAPETARAHFPLLNLIGVGVIVLLLGAIGWLIGSTLQGSNRAGGLPSATPALMPMAPTLDSGPGSVTPQLPPGASPSAPSAAPPTALPSGGTAAPPAPTAAPPTATTPQPPATAEATLPLGTILSYDGWQAVLLQPDYSLFLDGSIGDLRPNGRFILALLAISNDAATPRRIPADLFVLSDGSGRRYLPLPGASTAYLSACGRGLCGDLALEDTLDAGSGLRTVPLIFDVPPGTTTLTLRLSTLSTAGWPITSTPPQDAPAGP